jgi:trigger factor
VKNEIIEDLKEDARNQLYHDIYHILIDNTIVELPENFLKKWMLDHGEQKRTPEQVETEFSNYKNQLKWSLISDKLIKDNAIEVSPEEMLDKVKQNLINYFGFSGDRLTSGEWLDKYALNLLKDKRQRDDTYNTLLTQKVYQAIENQITPLEKTISFEAFKKMREEHHHQH